MAGSKRANVLGFTIVASPDELVLLRRQSSSLITKIFHEAQDHGQSHLSLEGIEYSILRRADHTFTLQLRSATTHTTL